MTQELKPRIVVFGVGGAGGNAVDNMIEAKLQGVEFVVANTDAQALERATTQNRIQLGLETTSGLGAGARPDVGAAAAEESIEDINAYLEGAHMVFIAAGLGGGTGTGAAPIIAKAAHDKGILTVGVVTKPFSFEGGRRMAIAEGGLDRMRTAVDTMIVVPNQNLFRVANERTTFAEAFRMADDVLYSGVRGITDLMVMPGLINLDFADVRTIMKGMGSAMMGMGEGEGEERALEAARAAIDNPLLDDVSMKGAKGVLINITGGYDMTLFELDEAANEIRREVDPDANIILGSTFDAELEGRLRVSVVAAGLEAGQALGIHTEETVEMAKPVEVATPETEEVSEPAERPKVVVSETKAEPESDQEDMFETDPRPDFRGRQLPPAHMERQEGDEQVSADQAFGRSKPKPAAKSEDDHGGAGFANLFGWRKGTAQGDNDEDDVDLPEKIVSSPEDHPDAAPFDDADLEIPAFLRRSANH
ncbi:cell division protein FtsZ [Henriciella aquimarina]|uniref:cell division protein FtsZ n=1 Tax=Henriciella aquimarina TaxID=545261 RepID=UPI000A05E76E|nr:cell division protein FtsZ [Henriciella aquimarina]